MVIVGTEAASSVSELVSVTVVPLPGAAELSVTVQVAGLPVPPPIVDGLQVNPVTDCACAVEKNKHRLKAKIAWPNLIIFGLIIFAPTPMLRKCITSRTRDILF